MDYIIPMNSIVKIKVSYDNIEVTYDDGTKRTMIVGSDTIIFERDYVNKNNTPIIDHCI
jgi:hypothetical protein